MNKVSAWVVLAISLHAAAAGAMHLDLKSNPRVVFVGVDSSNPMSVDWTRAQNAAVKIEKRYQTYVGVTEKSAITEFERPGDIFEKRQAYGPRNLAKIHAAGEAAPAATRYLVTNATQKEIEAAGVDFSNWSIVRP